MKKIQYPIRYNIPDEFKTLQDGCNQIDDISLCNSQNKVTKRMINYELCKIDGENKCTKNKIKSNRLLLFKNDIEIYSIIDLYLYLGIEYIYDEFMRL